MAAEKKRISEALKEEVEEAARASNLKPVETVEKNVLPSQEDINQEKVPQEAANFDHDTLKSVKTNVKQHLPGTEDLAREKTIESAANFDKDKLNHVEPNVKTSVEVIDH